MGNGLPERFGRKCYVMVSSAKVLCVGLGDLVSSRNATLRTAGFDVVTATCLEEVVQQCGSLHFDVAIVGLVFSSLEKAQFAGCLQGVFRLPVILITADQFWTNIRADSYIRVDAPWEDLVGAVNRLAGDNRKGTRQYTKQWQF
jgi:hypothetical protein